MQCQMGQPNQSVFTCIRNPSSGLARFVFAETSRKDSLNSFSFASSALHLLFNLVMIENRVSESDIRMQGLGFLPAQV
jgi:hypothetical protein